MKCPSCRAQLSDDAWICELCEFIVDPSVLMPASLDELGEFDSTMEHTNVVAWSSLESTHDEVVPDAVLLGLDSVESTGSGLHAVGPAGPGRSALFYAPGHTARILAPSVVPRRVPGARLPQDANPYERHIWSLVDGHRSVKLLQRASNLAPEELTITLLTLQDRGLLEVTAPADRASTDVPHVEPVGLTEDEHLITVATEAPAPAGWAHGTEEVDRTFEARGLPDPVGPGPKDPRSGPIGQNLSVHEAPPPDLAAAAVGSPRTDGATHSWLAEGPWPPRDPGELSAVIEPAAASDAPPLDPSLLQAAPPKPLTPSPEDWSPAASAVPEPIPPEDGPAGPRVVAMPAGDSLVPPSPLPKASPRSTLERAVRRGPIQERRRHRDLGSPLGEPAPQGGEARGPAPAGTGPAPARTGGTTDSRDARDPRDAREPRAAREPRDAREARAAPEARAAREPRDARDSAALGAPALKAGTAQSGVRDPLRAKKARQLYEQALNDELAGNLVSARMNMKLALTFAPSEEAYRLAFERLSRLAETAPKHAQRGGGSSRSKELYDQATAAEERGDWDGAVELLEKALRESEQAAFHNRLGVLIATKQRRFREAQEHIERAIELQPGNPLYERNLHKILQTMATWDVDDKGRGKRKGGFAGLFRRK